MFHHIDAFHKCTNYNTYTSHVKKMRSAVGEYIHMGSISVLTETVSLPRRNISNGTIKKCHWDKGQHIC